MTAHVSPDSLPVWRLDDLYAGREDPRIDADLDAAAAANAQLVTLKGRLVGSRSDRAVLGGLLDQGVRLYESASNALWRVGAFAGLAASTARDDPDWARFEADIRTRSAAIGAESLFSRRRALASLAAPGAGLPAARTLGGPGADSGRPKPGGGQLDPAL